MTRWHHGVVIGKFRPPHKGHALLIDTALQHVERLTIIVCADASDAIPAPLRADWLRELHPSADVLAVETTGYDPDDSALWARLTRSWLGDAPDVVFTSEAYGPAYARHLGCEHITVDQQRSRVPISGSRILVDPTAHLEYLDGPARAYFVPRVVLVGAESTGKTTLARALAARYRTTWAPEYGRTFWDGLLALQRIVPTTSDFLHIAEAQIRLEDQLARHAHSVVFCDTDAFCTWLWHERYIALEAPALRALADRPRWRQLYVLTGDEIPWEDDGTRERQVERHWFHQRFQEELQRQRRPFIVATGPLEQRISTVVAATERLFKF
jgi:NadR type nicotinamide-nucleotide adenylyltransferase